MAAMKWRRSVDEDAMYTLRRFVEEKRVALLLRKCASVGKGCRIEGAPTIKCWPRAQITIGARFHFSSSPETSHLVAGEGAQIQFGDDVWIGYGASLSANRHLSIGDGTKLGPFVTIMDTDFHVAGDRSAPPAATPILIGREVSIGTGVTILRGTTIGDGARVGPCSVVSGLVPPGVTVAGVPARERGSMHGESGDVSVVVMQTLGLPAPPALEDGPRDVPGWDSLGALKLLLALEDVFGVAIEQDELVLVRSVRDLESLVERALARRAAEDARPERPRRSGSG
jgi:acetyltransferase-like isoleucine patch superfamily enzyme/acyl carrier protein